MKNIIKQKMYGFLAGAAIGAVFSCPSFVWAQAQERTATREVIKMDAAEMSALKDKMADLAKENPELFKEVTSELKESVSKGDVEFAPKEADATKDTGEQGKEEVAKEFIKDVEVTAKETELKDQGVSEKDAQEKAVKEVTAKEAELKDQGVSEKDAQEKAVKEVSQTEVETKEVKDVVEKEVTSADKEIVVAEKEVTPVEHDNLQDTRDQQQLTADEGKSFDNPTDAQTYADSISATVHDHGTDADPTQRYHVHPPGT